MTRWEPGAAERLQEAALELFATRGFEQTTATEIAQSVGLTERTFFRHFSDKREVLFHGQHLLTQAFLAGVENAPPDASPWRSSPPRCGPRRPPSSRTSAATVREAGSP
ncbi:TetR/AcrR family transcriptional regulator [Nonomuraea rubra]|uniref:TetR/AcrR family transcriptional regulator n=1 Tax=Nonomuraea rubra TaxID=46180 RepID=UPI0036140E3A